MSTETGEATDALQAITNVASLVAQATLESGLVAIVIVVTPDGAYRIGPTIADLNINVGIGVLTRAARAMDVAKGGPTVSSDVPR